MNMEIQINERITIAVSKKYVEIANFLENRNVILSTEDMDAIVEAYFKEKYPDYWKHIKHRIDTAKEYQRVVTAIYATENPKTSENV